MIFLRQSTASQEVPLGYFLDSTDGNTEETGLTIANTDIKIWKAGATTLANKNSGGATHISNGIYYAVLDATDTDTIGSLKIFVHVSGALAVALECVVLDEAVYDVQFGTTAPSTLTATQVNAEADTALSDYGALKPTTAGRTLDVTATGEAGIDWANVGSPTTVLNLSGTTVKTATDVETDTANIQTRIPATLTGDGNIKSDTQRILTLVPGDYLDQVLNAWVSLMVRKDAGINVDFGTQYAMINQNNGSGAGTYNNTTDSQEALRDNIGTNGAALSLAKTTNITGFNDLSAAQVNAEADTALSDVGLTTTVTGRIDAAVSTRATPAQVNTEMVDVIATDIIADSVATDGTRPTVAQALLMITRFLFEKNTGGTTTVTVNKEDGTTASMTFTLNSASAPTSITRAS